MNFKVIILLISLCSVALCDENEDDGYAEGPVVDVEVPGADVEVPIEDVEDPVVDVEVPVEDVEETVEDVVASVGLCGENEEERDCGPYCPLTCDILTDKAEHVCIDECIPGCYCKKGFVRNEENLCVPTETCFPRIFSHKLFGGFYG